MNIYLIGFMGVGKSTVAKELSKRLDYQLIDTDDEIESREARSISDIFERDGEEYFRGLERELIRELSSKDNLIVSCGGGIIKCDENIRLMRESGKVVLLEASPETIYERVKDNDSRPLLQANPGIEGIKNDPLCIVSDNETAFGVLALFSALFYGIPMSIGNIIIAQSFFIFMILLAWYKFGFGIGLVWTVISSAIMGVKAGSTAYLPSFLIIVLSVYALQIFIDGGRLMQVALFLIVYYAAGFAHYDMLLSDDGIKALYSALLS